MKTLSDHELIALSLREHAQTCEEIAHQRPSTTAPSWLERARRCRELAKKHEHLAKFEVPAS